MPTEREKMLAGELYNPLDPDLLARDAWARDLCWQLNATHPSDKENRRRILKSLFGAGGDTAVIQPPFFCDYGENIYLGQRVFFNFNCVILDGCQVKIGDYTMFGPAVQIYTAAHPSECPAPPRTGILQTHRNRRRRLGRWRRHHLPRRPHRKSHRHRRWQRRHPRHPL